MLDRIKRLFSPADAIRLPVEQTVAGETLDQEIDAIRQTQTIDPSRLEADPEAVRAREDRTKSRRSKKSALASDVPATPLFRPILRPPMAFLAALDDGSIKDAELIRLRGGPVTIGREQGDVRFPHEVLMSSKHAQLECRRYRAGYQWHFTDLGSRNGSFFRVQRAYLRDNQEFLIGHHRFAFRLPLPDGSFADSPLEPGRAANETYDPSRTAAQQDARATQLVAPMQVVLPKLLYRDAKGPQQTFQLESDHIVIGSDRSTCALPLTDAFVCPNHARLHRGPRGWLIEDLRSQNGVWLRLQEAKLDQVTEFQLGEQRFYFRPPKRR